MEDTKSTDEDDPFFDAFDEFPFFDCFDTFESVETSSSSPQSTLSSPNSDPSLFPTVGILRQRRSSALKDRSSKFESVSESVVSENVERIEENSIPMRVNNDEQFSFLYFLAELIVKAIGFQFNLLISFVTFPFRVLYYCFMIAVNPFYIFRVCRDYMIGEVMKMWKLVGDFVTPFVSEWLKEHKSVLKLVLRCGLGLFWSIYVCLILVTLLISSFVISGLIMRYYLVEQPFQLKHALNFDFTKSRPAAFVPITVCPGVECSEKNEVGSVGGVRVVPLNHKLQATVTLVLPESYYNRNLGIFQIRVDFLSENGKSLASLSHISMLEFKSEPIRILSTFFKVIPLVSGYMSESQTLSLKFRGYNEGAIPTACVKVTIEQRAEFRPGAGIPEIYDAFLHLESELPFLKRCIWHWRRTIFVWVSMMLFVVELSFAMLCCRPLLLPRARTRVNSGHQTSSQVQNQNTS